TNLDPGATISVAQTSDRIDSNSSFATATPLGTIGLAGRTLAASIDPTFYDINFPGSGDAPGDRNAPYLGNSYLQTPQGQDPDPTHGVETITYDFHSTYGFTPQGQPLLNAITENQKQRAREGFELISKHTGIMFKEVDLGESGSTPAVADITVATGDLRAIIPSGGNNYPFQIGNPVANAPANADPTIKATLSRELVILNANPPNRNWGNSE